MPKLPPIPQRRYARTERTRAKLLSTATTYIAERGLAAATLEEVAGAAGISRGVVQYHFGSKHELVLAVLHQVSARVRERVLTAVQEVAGPADRIERLILGAVRVRIAPDAEARTLTRLQILASEDESLRTAVLARRADDESALIDVLSQAMTELRLKSSIDATEIMSTILNYSDGLAIRHLSLPFSTHEHDKIMRIVQIFAAALFADGSPS